MEKMKLLILGNVMLPDISQQYNRTKIVYGGWLTAFVDSLKKRQYEITYCFPQCISTNTISGATDDYKYIGFYYQSGTIRNFSGCITEKEYKKLLYAAKEITDQFNADILHVFGTEFPYASAFIEAFNNPERTVVHIQGLISIISLHYLQGIPNKYLNRPYLSNLVRGNLSSQQKNLAKRGVYEIRALKNSRHVIGRTDWDKGCSKIINNMRTYHFCNELLRNEFYDSGKWSYENCQKHSILFSQASNPIKGFHYLLEALAILKKNYPDIKVYVAGNNPFSNQSFKKRIGRSAYAHFINDLINANNLRDNIVFIGPQATEEIIRQYFKCNVFVSSSTIENSSNSICEAMMLGVPVVSSDVGGVKSLIKHEENGLIFQPDASYMLAHCIDELFNNTEYAKKMAESGYIAARKRHNHKTIMETIDAIYQSILKSD